MKANQSIKSILAVVAAASTFLAAHSAEAAQYHVTVDTSSLLGSSDAPFALDFQMNGGGALSNTVILSNFSFGLGSATSDPAPTFFGNGTGDLSSSVSLTANSSSAFNEFFQGFAPGSILGFDVNLTTNVNGPQPDGFVLSILDKNLFNIETNGVGDSLLLITINDVNPTVQTFTSTNGVSVSVAPVPEPTTLFFGAAALGAIGMVRRRQRAA